MPRAWVVDDGQEGGLRASHARAASDRDAYAASFRCLRLRRVAPKVTIATYLSLNGLSTSLRSWFLVLTPDDAHAVGANVAALRLMAHRGTLERIGLGVCRIPHLARDRLSRCQDALLRVRNGAVLSHGTALDLHGPCDVSPALVSVTVPSGTRLRRRPPDWLPVHHDGPPRTRLGAGDRPRIGSGCAAPAQHSHLPLGLAARRPAPGHACLREPSPYTTRLRSWLMRNRFVGTRDRWTGRAEKKPDPSGARLQHVSRMVGARGLNPPAPTLTSRPGRLGAPCPVAASDALDGT